MKKRDIPLFLLPVIPLATFAGEPEKPNILIILADHKRLSPPPDG